MKSPAPDSDRLACHFITELVVWGALTGGFLHAYIGDFGAESSVILPHATVILAFWLGLVGIRLAVWRLLGGSGLSRPATALLVLLPPIALGVWYAVIFVGLSSWGRVPTWSLVWTYVKQSPHLLATLGFPAWLLPFAGATFLASLTIVAWRPPRLDWCEPASRRLSSSGSLVVALSCVALALTQVLRLSSISDFHSEEPIGASFFPIRSAEMQTHAATASPSLDAAERRELAAYRATPALKARNVVLIIGDALRASHMGVYGYERQTTPHLAASTHIHQTWIAPATKAICAESLCGLLSLSSSRPLQSMPSHPIILHEILRRHGYRVRLALGGDHTNFYGLRDAYGRVDSSFDGTDQSARYVNDDLAVLDYLETLPVHDGTQPELLQLHLMSTHGLGTRHDVADQFEPSTNYYRWPTREGGRAPPKAEDAQRAVNYYDNGVRQFDLFVSRILDTLDSKGYLDNALIVISGDHGEMLGETGVFGHRYSVDESVLTVPLVIQRRGYTGDEFGTWTLTSQVDVAPTILAELGIRPPATWKGVALQTPARPRYVYFRQGSQSGAYFRGTGPLFKYWIDQSSGQSFLFDVDNDPLGHRNLIPLTRPDLQGQLMLRSIAGAP